MIVVALGSNRAGPWGNPSQTVEHALAELNKGPLRLLKASRLLFTAPFGRVNQAPFVNAIAIVQSHLPPQALLHRLHAIEFQAGRRRAMRWGPRTLDLDLIDYDGRVTGPLARPRLPHPGIAERIFVLKPLAEIAPNWRHPVSRLGVKALLKRLHPQGEGAEL
ncbi:2-amino-4-hydroxy-6-hydroxymethyldihydropteridine diphosphokinase [Aestuariivirga sp.]|uniref:2-amino-4-hydroxy-6- hydroxymethyldihydropteridine diphosphokinase n=1 Tax=Aestuariivirga sp. TaxID=2650926 RepID=UPI0039E4B537